MASTVIAYIVMACIVMAYIVTCLTSLARMSVHMSTRMPVVAWPAARFYILRLPSDANAIGAMLFLDAILFFRCDVIF